MAIIIRRNLPWGRESSASLQQDGADKIPDATRKAGYKANGNQAAVGEFMDQIAYEAQFDVVLGSASQLAIDAAQITWSNSNQRFENKLGAEVVLGDYARVAVIGMDTLTSNIVIDNVVGLEMFHLGGTPQQTPPDPVFRMGDSGGGVPYKILLGSNTNGCKFDLMTDKPFAELDRLNLTQVQKQYVANQGRGNRIRLNGDIIYDPSEAGQIIQYDTLQRNPYLLRVDGGVWPWAANVAVNGQAWFRDINIALGGVQYNGSTYAEGNSRFTIASIIAATPYLFQTGRANRFFTDISPLDTRIHRRTDPNGVVYSNTASFVSGANVVSFANIGVIKDNMRISGATAQGIPESPTGTTILKNVDTSANTAEMYDALTEAPVNATATIGGIVTTFDNSGAVGGSHDDDYFQNIRGSFEAMIGEINWSMFNSPQGVFSKSQIVNPIYVEFDTNGPANKDRELIGFDASGSPGARAHDQTQPKTSGVYYFYKA